MEQHTTPVGDLASLAAALDVDELLLLAVISGRVDAQLFVNLPTGGCCIYKTLAEYEQDEIVTRREARAGLEQERNAPPPRPPSRFFVYWLLDADGRVVYVGSTRNLEIRIKAHRTKWGDAFDDWTAVEFSSAALMLAAEREAIRLEPPPLNLMGIG